MSEPEIRPQPRDPADDEIEDLVVATPDERLVLNRLSDRNLLPDETIPGPNLGLTLLRELSGMRGRTAGLRAEHADGIAVLESVHDRPLTDVDVVLYDLRTYFAGEYAGWTPELGKNRWVDSVVTWPGGGRHDPMAVRNPAPVDAPPASAEPEAGTGVRIGIVDTAVYPHDHLTGLINEDALIDPCAHDQEWQPWEGHGTLVADLVLRGAPSAALTVRPVLGGGSGRATSWDIAMAIAGLVHEDIDILNLSLGCRTPDRQPPMVLAKAIDLLSGRVLVIAAAGNHAKSFVKPEPMWPAALPRVVAVGAREEPGAEFSPKAPWVRCTAPGLHLAGAYLDETVTLPPVEKAAMASATGEAGPPRPQGPTTFHGFARWNGTSFAAATVSGAVAARTVPGEVPAREALQRLLDDQDSVVKRYVHRP